MNPSFAHGYFGTPTVPQTTETACPVCRPELWDSDFGDDLPAAVYCERHFTAQRELRPTALRVAFAPVVCFRADPRPRAYWAVSGLRLGELLAVNHGIRRLA